MESPSRHTAEISSATATAGATASASADAPATAVGVATTDVVSHTPRANPNIDWPFLFGLNLFSMLIMEAPKIIIKIDMEKEVERFIYSLDDKENTDIKSMIFWAFPDLKNILTKKINPSDKKAVIYNFVSQKYASEEKKIKESLHEQETLFLSRGSAILKKLAEEMDYKWPENHPDFLMITTILPFSPHDEFYTFFFSIFDKFFNKSSLRSRGSGSCLYIAAHEISHLILFDIFREIEGKEFLKKIDYTEIYYLKELLADILLKQGGWNEILEINDFSYRKEFQDIFIKKGGQFFQIVDYFKSIYEKERYQNKTIFWETIEKMREELKIILPQLKEKQRIWNQYGLRMFDNQDILKSYREPILIKMG